MAGILEPFNNRRALFLWYPVLAEARVRWVARDVRGGSAPLRTFTTGSRVYVRAVNDAGYAPRTLAATGP